MKSDATSDTQKSSQPYAAILTGTFDPIHKGHLLGFLDAYEQAPFESAILGVIEVNPLKPDAATLAHRLQIVAATLAATSFPFRVEAKPIPYKEEDALRAIANEI